MLFKIINIFYYYPDNRGDYVIHSNLKLLMTLQNKKNIELAEEAKVDEYTIKKAKADKTIESCRLESLDKIATALNVKLDNLFDIIKLEDER